MDDLDNEIDLSNRMDLFRHLTSEELTSSVNEAIFKSLLVDSYDKFVEACDYVKQNKNKVSSVSCFIENGDIQFTYSYKEDDEP